MTKLSDLQADVQNCETEKLEAQKYRDNMIQVLGADQEAMDLARENALAWRRYVTLSMGLNKMRSNAQNQLGIDTFDTCTKAVYAAVGWDETTDLDLKSQWGLFNSYTQAVLDLTEKHPAIVSARKESEEASDSYRIACLAYLQRVQNLFGIQHGSEEAFIYHQLTSRVESANHALNAAMSRLQEYENNQAHNKTFKGAGIEVSEKVKAGKAREAKRKSCRKKAHELVAQIQNGQIPEYLQKRLDALSFE